MPTKKAQRARALQQHAKVQGGRMLSPEYKTLQTKVLWKCEHGHVWAATPANVLCGSWCPHCAGNARLTLAMMEEIATARGGECLAVRYTNNKDLLPWRCGQGHEWYATAQSVVAQGSWCRKCVPLTLEEMQDMAIQRGGRCLSKTYTNNYTHLRWECAEGHRWRAMPKHIKEGGWCPECFQERRRKTGYKTRGH